MIIKLISEWVEASGLEANRVRSNQENFVCRQALS